MILKSTLVSLLIEDSKFAISLVVVITIQILTIRVKTLKANCNMTLLYVAKTLLKNVFVISSLLLIT
ncbi:hypothetical protein ATX37_09515 [Oenococcus oeni]|nr:hypothetical protein ATX37_09515 [Oenococcus oeni]